MKKIALFLGIVICNAIIEALFKSAVPAPAAIVMISVPALLLFNLAKEE